jgi:heptaprenyl diphosphate synthase
MSAKRIAYLSLLTAIALVLHVLENALPPLLSFAPGAKMGLSNVVSLIALFLLGVPDAYAILIVRCVLGAVFGGNLWSLTYALPAGIISLSVQVLLVKMVFPTLSLTAISFIGALIHNVVQLIIASITVKVNLLTVLPLTMLASVIAGLFVGLTAYFSLKALPSKFYILNEQKKD